SPPHARTWTSRRPSPRGRWAPPWACRAPRTPVPPAGPARAGRAGPSSRCCWSSPRSRTTAPCWSFSRHPPRRRRRPSCWPCAPR
ncbi:unnamed protein product, partial [Prorocentrum cordatum]